jgi:hypothetical protein
MATLTETDATGRYRLQNVPPGRYYITAGRVDLPTYYPGTLDVKQGTAISITSAAAISDIDFVIQDASAALPAPGLRGRGGGPALPLIGNNVLNLIDVLAASNALVAGQRRGPAPNQAGNPAPAGPVVAPGTVGPVVVTRGGGARGAPTSQPAAAWWTDAALVARLGLTEDQRKKIEGVFEQFRQALVQNKADLEREEAALARMLEAEPMDSAKAVTSQIDRVVQARAEMERTNSRMTLEIRQNLTRAQWVQLQAETAPVMVVAPAGLGIATPGARRGGPGSGAPAQIFGTAPAPAPPPTPEPR